MGSPPPEVLAAFGAQRAEEIGGGHIHRTFVATTGSGARIVVQQLNGSVFTNLAVLVANVERIISHLASAAATPLRVVHGADDNAVVVDDQGGWWRAFNFLAGTQDRETVTSAEEAYAVAAAFGGFVRAIASLPGPPLADTIPAFHDFAARAVALDAVVAEDPVGRLTSVIREVDQARELAAVLLPRIERANAVLPVRYVHNDAKVTNVRFVTDTARVAAVLDFDTTMRGIVVHDIGELVRTTATRAAEDEVELRLVTIDDELYAATHAGFLAGAGAALDEAETALLDLGGPWLAAENGIRFLSDHLAGDRYFRVHRAGHNLDRARAQLRLAGLLLER